MSTATHNASTEEQSGDHHGTPSIGVRLLTSLLGVALIGSFLSVFYRVTAITGDIRLLGLTVGAAVALAIWLANRISVRRGLAYGALLLGGGVIGYLVAVPALHGYVFTVEFIVNWFLYLTGQSVLRFLGVDVWAIAVAPGPTFVTGYLILRRRYDLAAITGGLMLGFFALTGDAGRTTTLIGMVGLLGMLGLSTIEKTNGTLRQLEQVVFVLAIAVIGNSVLRLVPDGQTQQTGGGSTGGDGSQEPIAGALTDASGKAEIFSSISLSPAVQFTVTAPTPRLWHVSAYDRYTGRDWIRTGRSRPYQGRLSSPPGDTETITQEIQVERPTEAMPAAWKPVRISNLDTESVQVTGTNGLQPEETLNVGASYQVDSDVPTVTPDRLREAGMTYPEQIRERYLQVPEGVSPDVHRLAEAIGGEANTPYDTAIAIERWLGRNKDYSLTVDRPDGDIVSGFLLQMDRGYCVYYASAMAVMLRTLGIPARFVLGYTPGEDGQGQWLVRGIHSHAWVEVYFPTVGWVAFDPTPSDERRAEEQSRVGNSSEVWLDPLGRFERARSSERPNDQTDPLASPTPDPIAEQTGDLDSGVENRSRRDFGVPLLDSTLTGGAGNDGVSLLAFVVASAIGAHWVGLVNHVRRSVRIRRQNPTLSPSRDIQRAYTRLEEWLAARYRDRRDHETPRSYVEAVDAVDPRIKRVTMLYERGRYGSTVTREDADEAIRLVDELVSESGLSSRSNR